MSMAKILFFSADYNDVIIGNMSWFLLVFSRNMKSALMLSDVLYRFKLTGLRLSG